MTMNMFVHGCLLRTDACEWFPQYWTALKHLFDHALVNQFMLQKGIKPLAYVKKNSDFLAKLSHEESLKAVADALEKKVDTEPHALSMCLLI